MRKTYSTAVWSFSGDEDIFHSRHSFRDVVLCLVTFPGRNLRRSVGQYSDCDVWVSSCATFHSSPGPGNM